MKDLSSIYLQKPLNISLYKSLQRLIIGLRSLNLSSCLVFIRIRTNIVQFLHAGTLLLFRSTNFRVYPKKLISFHLRDWKSNSRLWMPSTTEFHYLLHKRSQHGVSFISTIAIILMQERSSAKFVHAWELNKFLLGIYLFFLSLYHKPRFSLWTFS